MTTTNKKLNNEGQKDISFALAQQVKALEAERDRLLAHLASSLPGERLIKADQRIAELEAEGKRLSEMGESLQAEVERQRDTIAFLERGHV